MSLLQVHAAAHQPLSSEPPHEWAAENVRLFRSTDSSYYRPEFTPWWNEPMAEMLDDENKEIVVTAPVGSGKSTMIEAMACCLLDRDPGPTLITGQTDDDIQDWAETGLWPTLRACEAIQSKLPSARGKWTKDKAMIERAPIHLTGANMSGLQSKSERYCIGDEAWMWKQGMIGEMRKRIHRRWNGRIWLLGQAGWVEYDDAGNIIGDDFTLAHDQGEQREWCFACPQCGDVQPYDLEQLKYPGDGTKAERALECAYECGNCKTQFGDTDKDRRKLTQSSRYEVEREAKLPGHISFHFNVLALHRAPWSDVVLEYLGAQESLAQGLSLPMEQFRQKQMAKPWDSSMTIERPDLDFDERKVEDFANGEPLDGEADRFLTVDVQRDHYWIKARLWRGDGSSLGIWYGKINTEEGIEKLREKLKIQPVKVLMDSGYDAGRVYDICVKYGYTAIKGDGMSRSYTHPIKAPLGKKASEERLFSRLKHVAAPKGGRARLVHLATDELKDVAARLREGKGAKWQVVANIEESYGKQLDSEQREEFLNPQTNQPKSRWVKKKRDNHSWDCEVYQTAAALIWRIF